MTISGDLGQAAVFVNEDKQKMPYIGSHGEADVAELLGDLDGFNIGFREPKGGSGKKLSEILLAYYCSCKTTDNFRERTALFERNDGSTLEDQVRRFAWTYVYGSEGAADGLLSEVKTEANGASAEFRDWAKKRKALELKRVQDFEKLKKDMSQ